MSLLKQGLDPIIKALTSKNEAPRVKIEDVSFRLHFRITTSLLMLFAALLCLREYIGENIKCSPNHDHDSEPIIQRKWIEKYCFIQTTFTVPYNHANPRDMENLVRDTLLGGPAYVQGRTEKVHHAYYQWVPFYLFFLGMAFYAPHWLWKSIDNKKIQLLVQKLNIRDLWPKANEKRNDKVTSLATYLVESRGTHGYWAFSLVMCEILNLVVVLGSMYLTDLFLGKEFSTYGPRVVQFLDQDPESRVDPMASVFPRVTKCLFHIFGPSSTIQRLDALCILPSNILNEKIFTFLWFWFVILAVLTIVALLYRAATLFSSRLRYNALKIESFPSNSKAISVLAKLGLSDWFLLNLIRLNLDHRTFNELIEQMYEDLV